MQSGPQQGGGGHGRNMVPGPPSSSASPTSSSSAVSTPHLGFDPMKQQHQQQRQSLQQQLLRNPDGREAMLAYQSGIRQGVLGGGVASNSGSMQMQRVVQQHGQEEGQNMRQGFDQHMMNPMQQAYMQYALHAQQAQQAQQKSSPGMQAQQQMNMGNTKIQDILSFQTANQPQSSLSKKPLEQQAVSDQSQNQNQKHLMPGNSIRPMQTLQPQQSIHNMATSQASMAAQLQAMQAMALERNIDLSLPQNANMIAQMMPLMQSRMLGQQKVNESNMSPQSMSKQQVTNENQLPPRQPTTNGSGTSCMPPPQSPASMNRSSPQSNGGGSENPLQSQKQTPHPGFTKQQLHVLKAQILAFRRIKKGDKVLPRELLQAIAPPPLEVQVARSSAVESSNNDLQAVAMNTLKKEVYEEKEKEKEKEKATSIIKETPLVSVSLTKQEQGVEHMDKDKGKAVVVSETTTHSPQTKDPGPSRKYHGPLFDFPFFTRKNDGFGSSMMMNNNNNLSLAYDVKDLFLEEELNKRKNENLKKINGLLAVNLERKRIRPDLVLRLQIEEKKLLLKDVQTRVRDEVDQQQQEIMAMPDRPYRKFVRLCERQRLELNRQVHAAQRAIREKQLKSIFQWRKKLLESHWAIRDARTSRNRGVAKYHEKMLREFSKKKDDSSQSKRMEALKNNDVERYREILLEQQTSLPSEAAERYEVLSSFLSQTEDYLHKLGSKITAAKNQQEVEEAANVASTAARAQGLSEEEVRAAASCAREEVLIRNRFSEMNAPQDSSSVSKYYTLAHAVSEKVIRQPSMLRKGTLRDYQLVGLQWMLSLYNNKLNGILADEMGLGKTVQVMALIAYLMEFKSNYGPHLIIVPNAVLVNWKSELHSWLPSVSCIYYVGNKDQRSKLFSQEVCAMKFNVLVTTYEFIMFDRAKLSRVDWKYIIIDEAQRMKDRESVLARDLDKYRCQRRLLLTGTPLQNDLKELWSLLNLLLPDVFDNRKAFHDWFSQPFQKEASHNGEDDWLETEKKVIIIHRLHQILEPFMLRRRVEDVEGSLPPKISIILRCKMSAIQGAVYDWIKSTGTIRVDPEDEKRKVQKSSMYQAKTFKPLNNRCMELRKTCNHPLLNYPYFNDFSKDFLVKSCGKLWVLDRILIKLQRTGHRVLLFSTMTKLLDILEEYLQWRRLVYRRIDGTTSLEDRESAIVDFNSPDTDCFIFLLSIRAAGRGLNLQTADTVVIYDPDPNPKNEEQAVARAHRIGQTREVKVIYMEAVVDKVSSHQKEDNFRNGGIVDSDDDFAGKDRYIGSIESLIRNNIQQYKIDMADEVINAGRFDQRTTHEERRSTLETLLRDEERYQETVHDVPSLQEVNRMIARSEEEVEIFDQMDEEFDWTDEMTRYDQVPKWLRAGTREVNMTVARMSKKPPKDILYTDNIGVEITETGPDIPDKRRGRFKGKKFPNYAELDDDIDEFSEASSEEIVNRDSEDEYRNPRVPEVGSSGSSSDNNTRRVIPSAKFGSLSALESRPRSRSKSLHDDLEEGEIAAMSGESHMDLQKSGSLTLNLTRDRDRSEDDQQVLQPKIKRKRSVRVRPRVRVDSSQLLPFDRSQPHLKTPLVQDYKKDQSLKAKRTPPTRKNPEKPIRTKEKDAAGSGPAMTEPIQRRCKNVITKIQRRIDKEGQQIIPLLTDLWKRNESFLDLRKIEVRVDRLEYNGVMDLIGDVQIMLRSGMQFFGFSHEVRSEARKVHDLFFDIMKIAFPDTDFREARSALSFSGPMSTKTGLMPPKRPKPMTDIEPEPSLPPRPLSRVPRFGTTSTTRGGPGAAHGLEEEARRLTHPGELVMCKKKRKDREKSAMVKHVNASAAGPVSPIGRGIRSPGQSHTRLSQSQSQAFDNVGWANPVKKMRTDAGKRRPSQL